MKPMIGITPLVDTERDSYWILTEYMKGVEMAGGIPVMLPLITDKDDIKKLASSFDGFLFSGGPDIDPKYFGEDLLPECGLILPERDAMEIALFKEVLALGKPIFGICRGLQLINVAAGGSLYQDLQTQYPITVNHRMEPPYDKVVHKVSILPDTPFAELLACEELGVNTRHHQAIKDLAPSLKEFAISEDGLIEGIYMPDKRFVAATQWHPEHAFGTDMCSEKFFQAFVDACK